MRRVMLMGERGAGRHSLVHALGGSATGGLLSLAVEYAGPFVLPPAEFLENRRFYRALITASMECGAVLFVQDATRATSAFPPGFARLYNRGVLGVITKTDRRDADVDRATRFLRNAGLAPGQIIAVSAITGHGLDALRCAAAEPLPQGRAPA
ncbi:MAG: ethanolamine utilization protein EutP [Desulfovibrio sp.]|jgi:ethanolamine utilization protein EutP|nr:ethanolamine utilization protein EutP [Desulfovibrio sp.]